MSSTNLEKGNCIICGKETPYRLRSWYDLQIIPDKYICPECEVSSAPGTDPTGVL